MEGRKYGEIEERGETGEGKVERGYFRKESEESLNGRVERERFTVWEV